MSQVDTVALWIGLVSSVVSITLSVVAIWFTWAVNQRATAVNEEMIKSLEAIKSTTDHQSAEITDLIKVAWDKLVLGTSDVSAVLQAEPNVAEDALEEIQDVLDGSKEKEIVASSSPDSHVAVANDVVQLREQIEHVLEQMGRDRTMSQRPRSGRGEAHDPVVEMSERLQMLSSISREILDLILEADNEPLTDSQYQSLEDGILNRPLTELTRYRLLTTTRPYPTAPEGNRKESGYRIPENRIRPLRFALRLSGRPDRATKERVRELFAAVGYPHQILNESAPDNPHANQR